MNPKIIYKCEKCNKEYTNYLDAQRCCLEGLEKDVPTNIETPEDYVRMVLGIRTLECVMDFDTLHKLKNKCRTYLDKIYGMIMCRLREEIYEETKVEIEGKKYIAFDISDIMMREYNEDYSDDYDFVREDTRKTEKSKEVTIDVDDDWNDTLYPSNYY